MNHTKKTIGAIILALSSILGSVYLKDSGRIKEDSSLVSLIEFFVFIGLFVAYSHRVQSIGLLTLKLFKIEQTEKSVKTLSLAILDVLEKKDHGLMQESFDEGAYKIAVANLKKLAS